MPRKLCVPSRLIIQLSCITEGGRQAVTTRTEERNEGGGQAITTRTEERTEGGGQAVTTRTEERNERVTFQDEMNEIR